MRCGALVGALALVACGARTGLDVERLDGGVRADARAPDASARRDAGCRGDDECDDGIVCTQDLCEEGTCVSSPDHDACDDGRFCTGVERCVVGVGCRATPPACADAVSCTVDVCDAALDACVHEPDATLCPLSHRCDLERGCVARALVHGPDTLYEMDLPSGDLHVLGPTPGVLTDIALARDGTLWAATGSTTLARVDYVAGTAEDVVVVGGEFNALDVSPEGELYGATGGEVVRFDLETGARVTVARYPAGLSTSGDLAFVDGRLFGTARASFGGRDSLVELPTRGGGVGRVIGDIGLPCVYGLAPFGSTLYGMTCNGELISIDVRTGRGRFLRDTAATFYGAAAR